LKSTIVIILIVFAAWAYPVQAASAQPEQVIIDSTTPDYRNIHAQSTPAVKSNTPTRVDAAPRLVRRNYVGNKESTPTGAIRSYSPEDVQQLIKKYSEQYGISPDLPLRVAKCESGYNYLSRNSHSTASGVAQYIHSTWTHTEAGKQGLSVFDADANVHMMVKSIASGGISNWAASKRCWSK
jgi:hypothetical protein